MFSLLYRHFYASRRHHLCFDELDSSSKNYFVNSVNTGIINVKNLLPAKFGVVIASVVLVAGVEAAEPEAVDGETPQTTETPVASQENEQSTYDLYHTVVEGENLWVLAKRFTGNANNWKALAEANELNEKGTVQPGDIIRIPAKFNKVAIESVPETDTKIAGEVRDSDKTVTVPASFKGTPPADLPE